MPRVTVKFFAQVRMRTGRGKIDYEFDGLYLRDCLRALRDDYDLSEFVSVEEGQVRPHSRVIVNGRYHDLLADLDTEIKDGDRIAITYPYMVAY